MLQKLKRFNFKNAWPLTVTLVYFIPDHFDLYGDAPLMFGNGSGTDFEASPQIQ